MIRVGLIGGLGHYLEKLAKITIPTEVQWSLVSPGTEEIGTLDLVLYLKKDEAASGQVAQHGERTGLARISVGIAGLPTSKTLDETVQDSLAEAYGFVVGYTQAMHEVCRWVRAAAHQATAALDLRTLIIGETGTGKELVASAIHKLGVRWQAPFIAVNCGAMPSELAQALLFGHKRGSFTGAMEDREGALSAAGAGVLFLDEISGLPLSQQGILLRTLEKRLFSPIGSNQLLPLQAQVISATNVPLADAVESKQFRADLYFRIAQLVIQLPPLRERFSDIPLFLRYFLKPQGKSPEIINERVLRRMTDYDWPGNIRELRFGIERYTLMSSIHKVSDPLPWIKESEISRRRDQDFKGTLVQLRGDFEKRVVEAVLARCSGDTGRAARELGITRRSVYNLARRHGIVLKEGE
jgi:two-component system, NtrC family, response regulator HydG